MLDMEAEIRMVGVVAGLRQAVESPWQDANSQLVADVTSAVVSVLETLEPRYESFVRIAHMALKFEPTTIAAAHTAAIANATSAKAIEDAIATAAGKATTVLLLQQFLFDASNLLATAAQDLLTMSDWLNHAAEYAIDNDIPNRCVGCGGTRPYKARNHPAPMCEGCAALVTTYKPAVVDGESMFAEIVAMTAAASTLDESRKRLVEATEISSSDDEDQRPLLWVADLANEAMRQVKETRRHAEVFRDISQQIADLTKQAQASVTRPDWWKPATVPASVDKLVTKLEAVHRAYEARHALLSGAYALWRMARSTHALTSELVRWGRCLV